MDVVERKNKITKKLRLITSFLIITFSIIILIYSVDNYKITFLMIIILITKIVEVYLLKKVKKQFKILTSKKEKM
jgi:multisubunit Na+/H+ antiporter MnhG subunit